MPARVLVFCKKSVANTPLETLSSELEAADLMTLAECHDLPEGEEAAVEEMKKHLRWVGESLNGLEIHWHRTQRPIQVECGAPLDGEIQETLDELPTSQQAEAIRKYLSSTTEIVGFEMGIDGSHHLAATISEVLAFYLAEQGEGIVWFYHREFVSPTDRGTTLLQTD